MNPDQLSADERVRLAVIVDHNEAAAHVGCAPARTVRTFDLPPEVEAFIRKARGDKWNVVSLAIEVQP